MALAAAEPVHVTVGGGDMADDAKRDGRVSG